MISRVRPSGASYVTPAQAQGEPAAGDVVQPGRGHRGQRGRARVELEDPGGDLHPLRLRRDDTELAHRVEAMRLGHEHDVEPGSLVVGQVRHGLGEPARITEKHPYPHNRSVAAELVRLLAGTGAGNPARSARLISSGTPATGVPRAGRPESRGGPVRPAPRDAGASRGPSCPRPSPRAATATPRPGTRWAGRRRPGSSGAARRYLRPAGRPAGPARRRTPCRWPPRGRA